MFSFPIFPKPFYDEDSFQQALLAKGTESECSDTQTTYGRVTSSHTSAAPLEFVRCVPAACRNLVSCMGCRHRLHSEMHLYVCVCARQLGSQASSMS